MDISLIGGDRRSLYLKELLEKDNHKVDLIGFSKYHMDTTTIDQPLHKHIICGIPLARDGVLHMPHYHGDPIKLDDFKKRLTADNILIAGGLSKIQLPCKKYDLLDNEQFLQSNAILTAEGTLQTVIAETPFSLCGTHVVVIGFGRIGSRLASMFKHMGAKVEVVVRSQKDFSKASWLGFSVSFQDEINHILKQSLVIINTPPATVKDDDYIYSLGTNHLKYINKDALIIDVSSKPYGVHPDMINVAKTMCIGNIPGKTAPQTGAFYIKKVIDSIL